ncbi:MAG: VOC family protein [Thermoanaerobaculia bacterium]
MSQNPATPTEHIKDISALRVNPAKWEEHMAFYNGILGIPIEGTWGDEHHRAASLRAGHLKLVIAETHDADDDQQLQIHEENRMVMHLEVEDIEGLYEKLVARGAKPCTQPAKLHWGPMAFAVLDPGGAALVFLEWKKGKPEGIW